MEYEWIFKYGKGYWSIEDDRLIVYADENSLLHEITEASIGIILKKYGICEDCINCENFVFMDKPYYSKTGVCHVATVLSKRKGNKLPNYLTARMKKAKNGEIILLEIEK